MTSFYNPNASSAHAQSFDLATTSATQRMTRSSATSAIQRAAHSSPSLTTITTTSATQLTTHSSATQAIQRAAHPPATHFSATHLCATRLSMTPLHATRLALTAALSLMLAACGGGSTPAAATTPTPTPTLAAPTLTDIGTRALTKDTATNIAFANTGGAPNADDATPVGCTASDNLPAGLTVGLSANKLSCAITGAPSTVNATAVTVTVTATNATGTDNATVSITVADSTTPLVAPVLANLGTLELTKGTAVSNLVFVNSGGAPNAAGASTAGCTASEELPAGLVVGLSTNTLSCAITGTPNTANA
nr:putative Ig domain-containing protein [Pseudomonadota bacterium]